MQCRRNLAADALDTANSLHIQLLWWQLKSGIARVDTCKLDVLGYGISHDFAITCHGVEVDFLGVLDKLRYYHGVVFAHVGGKLQEAVKLLVVGADIHRRAREDVRRTHEDREANALHELIDVVHALERAPFRLVDA